MRTVRQALLLATLLPALVGASPKQTLAIAAAANLRGALEPLCARYQAHTTLDIQVTYGASGTFFAQLQSGAPFDLFLAADTDYPKRLADAGLAEGAPATYAVGALVLWVPTSSKADLEEGSGCAARPRR